MSKFVYGDPVEVMLEHGAWAGSYGVVIHVKNHKVAVSLPGDQVAYFYAHDLRKVS